MNLSALTTEYLKYDKRVYDHHTTKREFKLRYLLEREKQYKRITETVFVSQKLALLDSSSDNAPEIIEIPISRQIEDLIIIYDALLDYPSAVVKLLEPYYLSKLIININLDNISRHSDDGLNNPIIIYPLMYVKIYLPEITKAKFLIKFTNPKTLVQNYAVQTMETIKSKKIYKHFINYNKMYNDGDINIENLERTYLTIPESMKKMLDGISE
jgi:hypothetical protein